LSIGEPAKALEALLDQAALAEARGETPAIFARSLMRGPAEKNELVVRRGEIQLLSNHKAKGLEWRTVIQFGMFLEMRERTVYPHWLRAEPGKPPQCVLHGAQFDGADAHGGGDLADVERLLYVAATRPRHALIFVDDESLAKGGEAPRQSLAAALGLGGNGGARQWWGELPVVGEGISSEKTEKPQKRASSASAGAAGNWTHPECPENLIQNASAPANAFPRRVRPSTLAVHAAAHERAEPDLSAPPDYPEEQPLPGAAVDYGNWWHGVMERTPWAMGPEAWTAYWRQACATSPDPGRARHEVERLIASPLAARLTAPGVECMTETPMLWAEPGGVRAFDGCMDLAAWDAKHARWLVVDWKTDFVEGDYAAELKRRYSAQVAVYAQALAAMTGEMAEAVIYATRTGVEIAI